MTPRFVRITVVGELDDWPEPGAAAHTKIFLDGVMRTYTVRRFDRALGEIDIDFYLHEGNGPAARWAATARTGDGLQLAGRSRATFAANESAVHYLFAGDSSALPAIATCLEALAPSMRATVISTTDELPFETTATVHVCGGDDAFIAALTDADADADYAWIACEATVMRRARAALLERYSREKFSTRGYWKRGEANHPDHDTGDDSA